MTAEWVPFHKRLAKGPKRGLPRAVRFVLLELSLESRATRGRLDFWPGWSTLDAVHDLLGGDRGEIEAALFAFGGDAILIEKTDKVHSLTVVEWEKWAGPKTGAERQAGLRERRRVTEAPLRVVTDVTPTGQDKTEQNRTETTTGAGAPDGAGSKGRRGTRLPATWSPTPGSYAGVLEKARMTEAEALRVLEEFRDFWVGVPGQRGCKLDWDATFRNRLREVAGKQRRSGRFPSAPPAAAGPQYKDFKFAPGEVPSRRRMTAQDDPKPAGELFGKVGKRGTG